MAGRLSPLPAAHSRAGHRAAWLGVLLGVLVMHGCVMQLIGQSLAEFSLMRAMPPRIEVAYVREMVLAEPPVVGAAPKPAPTRPRRSAARPAQASSAPQQAPIVPEPPPAPPSEAVAQAATPEPAPPEPATSAPQQSPTASAAPPPSPDAVPSTAAPPPSPDAVTSAAAPPAAEPAASEAPPSAVAGAASAVQTFNWPDSTRISYALTGNYRGEVQGSAQVEWIRSGTRYQVHLDVIVGPSMAPLISRRMSSDGDITAEGLSPRRYDEDTKVVFRDRRRLTMLFEPDVVVMPSGERRERWPGVQDTASQFVQLTFIFTTQPELLRVGSKVDVPLALPRNIDRWTYDVVKEETLYTPFGEVPSFHVKPRRVTRPGGELSAEIWFAPQLRYLPVRIRIQQDAETYIDLVLDRRPQIASP
jgi:hypothetical protein